MLDKVVANMIEKHPIIGMLKDIEGPYVNPLSGKPYFEGIIDDGHTRVKIFFDIKYVEYGKTKIIQEKSE